MDIGLPGLDGIEATKQIKQCIGVKVILLTSHDSQEEVLAGLSCGADAYCLKDISISQLKNAINSVVDGGVWLDPRIAKTLIEVLPNSNVKEITSSNAKELVERRKKAPAADNPFLLSDREFEVLALLVDGLSNQEIASRLFLSTETVKTHMRHLMEKMKVSDRTQAAVKALREGLISY